MLEIILQWWDECGLLGVIQVPPSFLWKVYENLASRTANTSRVKSLDGEFQFYSKEHSLSPLGWRLNLPFWNDESFMQSGDWSA